MSSDPVQAMDVDVEEPEMKDLVTLTEEKLHIEAEYTIQFQLFLESIRKMPLQPTPLQLDYIQLYFKVHYDTFFPFHKTYPIPTPEEKETLQTQATTDGMSTARNMIYAAAMCVGRGCRLVLDKEVSQYLAARRLASIFKLLHSCVDPTRILHYNNKGCMITRPDTSASLSREAIQKDNLFNLIKVYRAF
jgi:hypothetical protein